MSKHPAKLRATPQERFWKKVEKTESCWLWNGAVTTTGYGVFQKGRRGQCLHKAHRFSYEIHHGEIPNGLLVLHKCDNKRCVNPLHLEVGNHSKNIVDAWARGLREMPKMIREKGKWARAENPPKRPRRSSNRPVNE